MDLVNNTRQTRFSKWLKPKTATFKLNFNPFLSERIPAVGSDIVESREKSLAYGIVICYKNIDYARTESAPHLFQHARV